MNKTLYLLRGLPGCGKSTLAERLTPYNAAADNFTGLYEGGFHPELLGQAHQRCQRVVENWMKKNVPQIAVHNTLTTSRELQPYLDLGNIYGYRIVSLVVENRHGSESVHNVPDEVMKKMEERFEIKLGR